MNFQMRVLSLLALVALVAVSSARIQQNQVKGQGQLLGVNGEFGVTYSLKSGFNFTLLSAKYSHEPFDCYGAACAQTDSKLLIIDFAIKNAQPQDNFFNTDTLITVADDKGQLIHGAVYRLESKDAEIVDFTLRPGQGLGQKELKDPLRMAISIPGKAVITKIMINFGRLKTNEEVVRYLLVAPPKQGVQPTNKNFISPLPELVRDPSDPYGAKMLPEGKAAIGTAYPSSFFNLRLDGVATPAGAVYDGEPAEEGKQFFVATLTAKSLCTAELSMFEVSGGDEPLYEVTDTDGERYRPRGFRKTKADEWPDRAFRKGEEYTFRVFFSLPKDAKPKQIVFGVGLGRKWLVPLG